ncbi:hypothetical protein PHLGIDRAFT_38344, partial [Phlebiopsis gigantea 11061_1 CR5-6]
MATPPPIPDTQRAWLVVRRGKPADALQLSETWPVPKQLGKGEVLVRVQAAAFNPVGHKIMGMLPSVLARRPHVAEHDFAGVVADANGTAFADGQAVYGWVPFVDYTKAPVHEQLAGNPPARKFHAFFEAVGTADPRLYLNCEAYLAPGGTFATVGPQPGVGGGIGGLVRTVLEAFRPRFLGGVDRSWVVTSVADRPDEFEALGKYIEDGKVKTVVDSVFAFEDVLKGYERVLTSRAAGKVVVKGSRCLSCRVRRRARESQLAHPCRGYQIMGLLPDFIAKRPHVAEHDFAGTVVDANRTRFESGQDVWGVIRQGALAQYARVPATHVALRPAQLAPTEAAGLGLAGYTAHEALFSVAQPERAHGCRVTSTGSGKREEFLAGLGVDRFVGYTEDAVHRQLERAPTTTTTKFRLMFDGVGDQIVPLFSHNEAYLAPGGMYVTVGAPRFTPRALWLLWAARMPRWLGGTGRVWKQLPVMAVQQQKLEKLAQYVADGTVKPVIDCVFGFTDVLKAYERTMPQAKL